MLNWVRPALGLGLVLALFFPAFFGDDASNIMTKSETDIIYQFLQTAKLGPIYSAGDSDLHDYLTWAIADMLGDAVTPEISDSS